MGKRERKSEMKLSKKTKTLLCVALVLILLGSALAGLFNTRALAFILLVVLGNSLGGLLIPAVQSLKGERKP